MAISQAQSTLLTDGMTITHDDAGSDTVARTGGGTQRLRNLAIDNTGVAALIYAQVFNDSNPVVGNDFAALVFPVPASSLLQVLIGGSAGGAKFESGLSYVLTDDPHGAALTGADRPITRAME